ncbi:MAG: alpha/beta fold hydrolase [Trebonia sp.]
MTDATLVLLASIALDDASWQWLDLPAGAQVAMPAYPGHAITGEWVPGTSLGDVADMVAAHCPGELDVVGISLGGIVAQHLAVRHPEQVRSLLIAGTTACSDPATMLARAEAAEAGMSEADVARTLDRWFTPGALARVPSHPGVGYARRRLAAMPGRSFAAAWHAMAAHDLRGCLRTIEARVTVVAGDADKAAPPAAMRELAAEFAQARFEVLHGPHLMQLETPEAFSAVLRAHLQLTGAAS